MQDVAIITDSVSCLPPEYLDEYRIRIIPINLYAGGRLYRDGVDITPSQAYELFLEDPSSFKTSAPSPQECLDVFRAARQQSPNILCINLSTCLSTTHDACRQAKAMAEDELPDTRIEVIDSGTATIAEGFVALAAARAATAGKGLEEVTEIALKTKEKVSCLITLDTIRHVYRSGRIPRFASQIGSILSIRPILNVAKTVNFVGAARSREHGIDRLLKLAAGRIGEKSVHMAVMHAYAPKEAYKLKERVTAKFNCVETLLAEFSPIMGYACGTGTLGIAFYPEP